MLGLKEFDDEEFDEGDAAFGRISDHHENLIRGAYSVLSWAQLGTGVGVTYLTLLYDSTQDEVREAILEGCVEDE